MNRTLLREEGDEEDVNRQDKKKREKDKFQDAEKKKKMAFKKTDGKRDVSSSKVQPVAGMVETAAVNPDAEGLTSPVDTPPVMLPGVKGYVGNVIILPPPRPVTLQQVAHQHHHRGNWPQQQQQVGAFATPPHLPQVQLHSQTPPLQYIPTPFQSPGPPPQQVQGQFVPHPPHQQGHLAVSQYPQVGASPGQAATVSHPADVIRSQSMPSQAPTQAGEQVQGSHPGWSPRSSASPPPVNSAESSWVSNSVEANEGRTWRAGAMPINSNNEFTANSSQWAAFSPIESSMHSGWMNELDEDHSSSDEEVDRGSSPELMGEEGEVLLRAPSLASFAESISSLEEETEDAVWRILPEQREYYTKQFKRLQPAEEGVVKGHKAREFFMKSSLPVEVLSKIWHLSDLDKDNALNLDEFCIAMHLVVALRHGLELPSTLPAVLLPAGTESEAQPPEPEPEEPLTPEDEEPEQRKVVSPEHWLRFRNSPTPDTALQPANFSHSAMRRKAQSVTQPIPVQGDDLTRPASLSDPPSLEDVRESHRTPLHITLPQSPAQPADATPGAPTSPSQAVTAEIARPRATVKLSLLDALPGQLLPPPSGKQTRDGWTPTSKVIYQARQTEVTSPDPSSPLSSPTPEATPNSPLSSDDDDDERKTPSPPPKLQEEEEVEHELEEQHGKEEIVYRPNRRSGERPRSTGDVKSTPPADTSLQSTPRDEGSQGSISSEGRREPPPPPPRNKKGHSRSSSLDLNKLFAAKAKENRGTPTSSTSSSHSSQNSDAIPPVKSEPTTPRRTTTETPKVDVEEVQEDGKPEKQDEDFADFSVFDSFVEARKAAGETTLREKKSSSSHHRNHRRSFSLDHGRDAIWSQPSQLSPSEASTTKSRPAHTNEALPRPVPKLKPPSPPTLKQGRRLDKDGEKERKLKTEPPKVVVRPLTKEDKLNARVNDLKEKNVTLSRVNSELQQELKTVMERRVNLEVKLEQLKSASTQQ